MVGLNKEAKAVYLGFGVPLVTEAQMLVNLREAYDQIPQKQNPSPVRAQKLVMDTGTDNWASNLMFARIVTEPCLRNNKPYGMQHVRRVG
jgi:hypothetical protein